MKFTHAIENYKNIFNQIGKNKWVTLQEIIWYIDYENKNEFRIIPKDYIFNGGNSPCFAHCIVDDDDFPFAFCGHDFDYSGKSEFIINDINNLSETFKKYYKNGVLHLEEGKNIFIPDRKFADLILLDTIQVEGLSRIKANLTYLGVRVGGKPNFIPHKILKRCL